MNETVFNYLYSYAHINHTLDIVIIFFAQYFPIIILSALFVYLFKHRDNPAKGARDLFVVSAVAISAWFIASFLKDVFQTLRPFDSLSWVTSLFVEEGYAFPSGHATAFMALGTILWFYHERLAIFFIISAGIIGIARVVAGVHFPVDILGGLFLGVVLGVGLYKLITLTSNRLKASFDIPIAK